MILNPVEWIIGAVITGLVAVAVVLADNARQHSQLEADRQHRLARRARRH